MTDGQTLYLTGERTLPDIEEERYWFARHVAGYRLAMEFCCELPAAHVLDLGCGEGYGVDLLAQQGFDAVGVDIFESAARHARRRYRASPFACADAAALPFPDDSFDAVVSLQVIEHVPDPGRYLAEAARVIRPAGGFFVATPNRLTFTPPGRPKNPFHIVEFSAGELSTLLAEFFDNVEVTGIGDAFPGLADTLIDNAFAATPPPSWASETVAAVTPAAFGPVDDIDYCLDLIAACS